MSSKKVEDAHTELINKLLSDSGLVCVQSPRYSEESEEEIGEEEEGEEEEEPIPEEHFEVEHYAEVEEGEVGEEISDLFPSPSLRKFLPERVRRIEATNRIKVLPEPFNTDINPLDIPKINYTAPKEYIDILAQMTGCYNYKSSLAEYWFLDTLANLLRRAQEDDMDKPTQAVVLLWFCEWIKEMQHFDAANRERMLRRWRDNMLAAAKTLAEDKILPNPDEAGIYYKISESKGARMSTIGKDLLAGGNAKSTFARLDAKSAFARLDAKSAFARLDAKSAFARLDAKSTFARLDAKSAFARLDAKSVTAGDDTGARTVEFKEFVFECALKDLTKIIHYIYDLFGTDFQYDLVRSIFTFGPDYHHIDGPFQIEVPKRIYGLMKPKKETKAAPKEKGSGKSKGKKEPDNEQYIALMQFIHLSNQQAFEKELVDREDWNRRSSILPLNFAATPEFFEQYWPTPEAPPPPPPPDPTPETKKKGKK